MPRFAAVQHLRPGRWSPRSWTILEYATSLRSEATFRKLTKSRVDGFDFQFRVRDMVEPITVNVGAFEDTFTKALIPALEQALKKSTRPVRALVMTNPHNPFGQMYPKEVLEACVKFCQEHDIHYISDEVYALSVLPTPTVESPVLFISALSLDLDTLGCDARRVHTIWSTSKDFGSSGIRMVSSRCLSLLAAKVLIKSNDTSGMHHNPG